MVPVWMTLSDVAKYSMTRSARGLSATAELLVDKVILLDCTTWTRQRLNQTCSHQLGSTLRAHTPERQVLLTLWTLFASTKKTVIRDLNQDFRINPRPGPGYPPDRSQNSGFTPCRRQSFCWIPWKAAGDCLRNANKCLKTSHSAMVREVEKWSGICIPARITTKSQSILPIGLPHHNTKFQCNWLLSFAVDLIPLTDTQIHKHD